MSERTRRWVLFIGVCFVLGVINSLLWKAIGFTAPAGWRGWVFDAPGYFAGVASGMIFTRKG